MKYSYPKISNCLIYELNGENEVEVFDYLTEDVYIMTVEEAEYVRKLDGKTHPYDIETYLEKSEINKLIDELECYDLLKESNKTVSSGGYIMWSMWEPKLTDVLHSTAVLWNAFLILAWLPVLVAGIFMFKHNFLHMDLDNMWLGYVVGLLSGIVLHELGHAFAAMACGARVFEAGMLVMYYIVPGAYVLLDQKTVKNRMQRIQINAAGVETNLFLTGLFLMLSVTVSGFGGMFLVAAINNAFLAFLNLTFIKGLDGTAIISELLGSDNVVENATEIVLSADERRNISKCGLYGKATVFVCFMICVFQIALPLLLVLNVLEVVLCFV